MKKSRFSTNMSLCLGNDTTLYRNYSGVLSGLENIMIFSKISKYRKCQNYHIFDIFDIFWKMKISNKLYNNGCNMLMQYLITIVTIHLYHALKLSFSRTILRYVRFMAWAVRLCLSSVTLLHPTQRVKIFCHIFAASSSSGTWAVCVRLAWIRKTSK